MSRSIGAILALSLSGVLAACAPAADAPSPTPTVAATPAATAAATLVAATPVAAPPSPSATDPVATPHDMTAMDDPTETSAPVSVEIANFAFTPIEITVSVGTHVTFTNLDSAPHTVTAGTDSDPLPELFDSGLLQRGESFTFVFDEPGTYVYYCERHPPMTATIVVEP